MSEGKTDVVDNRWLHLESIKTKDTPDNTPGEFTVIKRDPLILPPKEGYIWEVALEEIIIPNAIYNVTADMTTLIYLIYFELKSKSATKEEEEDQNPYPHPLRMQLVKREGNLIYRKDDINKIGLVEYKVKISAGFYDAVAYAHAVNSKLAIAKDKIITFLDNEGEELSRDILKAQFHFDNIQKKFLVELTAGYRLTPNTQVYERLGNVNNFEEIRIPEAALSNLFGCAVTESMRHIRSSGPLAFMCNMTRNLQAIFLYGDFVKYTTINNTEFPLLRKINLTEELSTTYTSLDTRINPKSRKRYRQPKTMLTPKFDRLQYIPVSKDIINQFHILLTGETSRTLEFQAQTRDITSCTLHFRQRKLWSNL